MRLRIGAHPWKVTFDQRVIEKDSHEQGLTLAGSTDKNHHVIAISRKQSSSNVRETLLHEVLHACFCCAALEPDNEEDVVNRLAKVLLSALRDNPKLVAFLLED